MIGTPQNRRTEERRTADGAVVIAFEDPVRQEFIGELVDESTRGFRVAHDCSLLHSGLEVEFRRGSRGGRARVMWSRINGEAVESGFFVL